MRKYKFDFHIHSCLSPCGSLEMSPRDIVSTAKQKGLDMIAITDHNSGLNCPALAKLCENDPQISCVFGIEVNTEEEVHVLTLFEDLERVLEMSDIIYKKLPEVKNIPDKFGDQVYVDQEDNILGEVDKFLGSPVNINLSSITSIVHELDGLVIPAHVDRPFCSLSSQLGFIPEEDFDAIEISKSIILQNDFHSIEQILNYDKYSHVTNSDSHYLKSIGSVYNEIQAEYLDFSILRKYLGENCIKMSAGF